MPENQNPSTDFSFASISIPFHSGRRGAGERERTSPADFAEEVELSHLTLALLRLCVLDGVVNPGEHLRAVLFPKQSIAPAMTSDSNTACSAL
jgi:hypothetical protein